MPDNSNKHNNDSYWANAAPETIGQYLDRRVTDYYTYITVSNYMILMRECYYQYFDNIFDGGQTFRIGSNGEFTKFSVNYFKNLIDHQRTIINQQRQEMFCQPVNTDFESLAQCKIGNKLIDYAENKYELGKYIDRSVFHALLYGEGFTTVEWDEHEGDLYTYDQSTGQKITTGDITCRNYSPLDVIRDVTKASAAENEWYIVRKFVNKYNLIAKYPHYKDEILGLPPKNDNINVSTFMNVMMFAADNTDDVAVYTFFHKKTAAVPEGRVVNFCSADLVLDSNPMPYRHFPVIRVSGGELEGTPFGYSTSFSMLQIQEVINGIYSGIQTNLEAGLVNNIWIPEGCNITEPMVYGGNNYNVYNPEAGKPEILDLAKTTPDAFNFLNILKSDLNNLSGISAVTQGQIPSANMSGAAMAFQNSMSLQFLNELQKNRVFSQEKQANLVISCYQDFAKAPRVAAIAGKSNEAYMQTFDQKDLVRIDRVEAKTTNPMSKTPAGQQAILETLVQSGVPMTKQEIFQLFETGEIETTYEGQENELLLIKSENEDLSEGVPVVVSQMDDHVLHISEHRFVTANPELRKNPQLMQAAEKHIMDHLQQLISLNPQLAQITGQPVFNQPPAANQPQNTPVLPPVAHPPGHRLHVPGNPGHQLASSSSAIGPGNPVQAKAGQVKMPNLPKPPKGSDKTTADLINEQRAANRPPTPLNPGAI
jgi:hypothetical protein